MEYMSAQEAAEKWGITKRRVQILCASNRIEDAVRVGNMWILPSTAKKPADGRIKKRKSQDGKSYKNPIRLARNKIKSITAYAIQKMLLAGFSHDEAKISLVSLFASELLAFYIDKTKSGTSVGEAEYSIEKITGYHIKENSFNDQIRVSIKDFINDYTFCCDDALSWCYQYANKIQMDALYSSTQFFTEKYMITSIVDSIDISSYKKIFDPACGGGNFLLYCLDILSEDERKSSDKKEKSKSRLQNILSRIYGYEIDRMLALVASINLRLKCLSLLCNDGKTVSIEDFESFIPNIFYPINNTVSGALDVLKSVQLLAKVGTKDNFKSQKVFSDIDVIVTNPPFQTIKGMPEDLKSYLKKEYPKSKCDMCNAFIELSYSLLNNDGVAGLVTQNSWMYLDSFIDLRKELLSNCTIDKIWEIGSNAFYDLSGEKSNVALLIYKKNTPDSETKVQLTSLKTMELSTKESLLSAQKDDSKYTQTILQRNIYENEGARFDMISSDGLRRILLTHDRYEKFAVPMQGTSTGNAKKLIDFFWKHINDKNWVLVSKGGGYSRWCGLNHYCVKWGKEGEYIKQTKGSVIRNASYFDQTQMVFSDTGTSGLNVRKLVPKQIFVASGPGIQIKTGKTNSHLSLLNSRFAAYYIRLLSPKLTIAAGYIAKIPVCYEILDSSLMEEYGKCCIKLKKHRLSKRPFNIEFTPISVPSNCSIEEMARHWFVEDIEDEWLQLQYESKIDDYIFSVMGLKEEDIQVIDEFIGSKRVFASISSEVIDCHELESIMEKYIDHNCNISRTKVEKRSLGCDGILEFLSQKTNMSCEQIYTFFMEKNFYPSCLKEKYENLYLHAAIVSALGYPYKSVSLSMNDMIQRMGLENDTEIEKVKKWVISNFNYIHSQALMKSPVFEYDPVRDTIIYTLKEE